MPRRGLPTSMSMRHDEHYVEALAASAGAPIGRLIPIDQIDPNPNQPRQVMGDLSELIASIAEKGILEPLVVRQRGERFQIVAGERRYQAAVQAGLRELPVVVRDVDDTEVIELALIENLQRKDLTPFEEAEALQGLAGELRLHARGPGAAAGEVADVGDRVAGADRRCPKEVRNLCRLADISAKSLLLAGSSAGDARENDRADREDRQPGRRDAPAAARGGGQAEGGPARSTTCSPTGRRPRRST